MLMLTESNDLLILLIGLLVLLLIVVLIAASKSKSNKTPVGGGGSTDSISGGGTSGKIEDSKGSESTGGGGIYIDSSLREGDGVSKVDRAIHHDADAGHDIVRIYVDKHRAGLIICPNCDTENVRGSSRCIACGYIL